MLLQLQLFKGRCLISLDPCFYSEDRMKLDWDLKESLFSLLEYLDITNYTIATEYVIAQLLFGFRLR